MKYLVGPTPRAGLEIRQITAWYAERSGSQEVANRWVAGLLRLLNQLEIDPQRHMLAGESPLFSYEVREALNGSGRRKTHRILFRVLDARVEVMAIRHSAQQNVTPEEF